MAQKNYFSHTDSLGRDPFKRMTAFGYGYNGPGREHRRRERNRSGHAGPVEGVDGTQPQHAVSAYKVIGISRSYSAASTYKWYWNTDFGGHTDSSVPCPR